MRGSGIPNVEGSVRGVLSFKWLRTLFGTLVGSFYQFFAGLPLGSEGPSVQLSAMSAQGVTEIMKAKLTWRRYIIAGGAGAGIAVAFNAPLAGIIFAMEECHKRITPMIYFYARPRLLFQVPPRIDCLVWLSKIPSGQALLCSLISTDLSLLATSNK